jgi:cellobiose transport system permease protein
MRATTEQGTAAGGPGARVRRRRLLRAPSDTPAGRLTYVLLVVGVILSAFPVYWTFVVASQSNESVSSFPPELLPGGNLGENIERVFATDGANFAAALVNTAVVAGCVTVSVLLFCSLAGFAFAKLRFRGRNALMIVVVATMTIPNQLGIIPLYILMANLGWTGDLKAVIVPGLVTAFGVFFMRQYISEAVPTELLEAARVDGASTMRMYTVCVLPAIRPAAAVLGLFTFMGTWNEFLWPLVVLSPDNPTVQVSLSTLAAGYYTDWTLVLAGTALATLPLLVLFLVAGKQLIGGIMEGVVKG